jgi:hypothetical protein
MSPPNVPAGLVKTSSIRKSAGIYGMGGPYTGGAGMSGTGGPVTRMTMKPISPLYQESNLMLPKDRKTMNAYNRHYYETDYWVGNAIDLHTYYPLGGFEIVSKNREVEQLFNHMADKMNLHELVLGVGQDYWIYGEAFPVLNWDKQDGMWSGGMVYNPDYMEVSRYILAPKPVISMIPDAELKRIATSTHPRDMMIREQIPYEILSYVLRGENIPLNPRSVSHVVRKSVPHDVRGTSIIQRVWKELMLRDSLREVLFVIAQNHITPLKIFKVGSHEKEYFPTPDELQYWQGIIEEAQNDPNFSIVTHDAFDVQYVGATGQIVDVSRYLEIIENNVLTGLFVSKAITTSEGPTYANAVVAYEILQRRYVWFRSVIEKWLINKVFLPVSIMHGFKDNQGRYQVPLVKWNRIDFNKDDNWKNLVMQLNQAQNKLVSDRTLLLEIGLNPDDEQEQIIEEKQADYIKRQHMKAFKDNPAGAGVLGGGAMGGMLPMGGGALPGMPPMGEGEAPGGAPPIAGGMEGAGAAATEPTFAGPAI